MNVTFFTMVLQCVSRYLQFVYEGDVLYHGSAVCQSLSTVCLWRWRYLPWFCSVSVVVHSLSMKVTFFTMVLQCVSRYPQFVYEGDVLYHGYAVCQSLSTVCLWRWRSLPWFCSVSVVIHSLSMKVTFFTMVLQWVVIHSLSMKVTLFTMVLQCVRRYPQFVYEGDVLYHGSAVCQSLSTVCLWRWRYLPWFCSVSVVIHSLFMKVTLFTMVLQCVSRYLQFVYECDVIYHGSAVCQTLSTVCLWRWRSLPWFYSVSVVIYSLSMNVTLFTMVLQCVRRYLQFVYEGDVPYHGSAVCQSLSTVCLWMWRSIAWFCSVSVVIHSLSMKVTLFTTVLQCVRRYPQFVYEGDVLYHGSAVCHSLSTVCLWRWRSLPWFCSESVVIHSLYMKVTFFTMVLQCVSRYTQFVYEGDVIYHGSAVCQSLSVTIIHVIR